MPANLTADFLKARERFRAAQTPDEKLAALEEMLTTIPKHKGTDKMQADIKRRIAKLRDAQSRKKPGRSSGPDHIERAGAGQVVLVGPPNSGKSSLLAALTNAQPQIGDYPYSTVLPVPGMMSFEDVPIQLIDLPPVTPEYTEPWVYNLIRESDLAVLALDGNGPQELPDSVAEIHTLLSERHIQLTENSFEPDDSRVKTVPYRIVLTKGDLNDHRTAADALSTVFPILSTSATTQVGLDALRKEVFTALRIIRVYTKLPGKPPDLTEPYTLPIGSTVLDAVKTVHREFVDKLKYVRLWGSGKFDGQQAPSDHTLQDRDVVEIHLT